MDGTIGQQSFDRYRYPQSGMNMNGLDLSPLSFYDSSAEFSGDSAPSRGSPVSPAFGANSFQLPLDTEWSPYMDKPSMSPELGVFFGESFGSPTAFMGNQNPGMGSTANPLDLMSPENVSFGRDDLNDAPLFQDLNESFQGAAATTTAPAKTRREQPQPAAPVTVASKTQTRSQRVSQRLPNRSADLKRKSSHSDSASSRSTSPEPPARRTKHADPSKNPHNLIEKRYRVNINEKIVALRDAVPALRCALQQQQSGESLENVEETPELAEELGGLMPARKLNKATILSKATEYISHLEKKNEQMARENEELQKRLAESQRWQRSQVEGAGYWA